MKTSDWIALCVGSYAAVVATIALVWNILRERCNVRVFVRYALSVGSSIPGERVAIEVVNKGRQPINIQEVGFVLSNNTHLVNTHAQYDFGWLKDGDGKTFYEPKNFVREIVEAAKQKRMKVTHAYIRDSTNHYYKGSIPKNHKLFNDV